MSELLLICILYGCDEMNLESQERAVQNHFFCCFVDALTLLHQENIITQIFRYSFVVIYS